MTTRRRAVLSILLLALGTLGALGACARGAGQPSPRSSLAGVWDLESVDGSMLPVASPDEPDVSVTSVTMTLGDSGEYALLSAFSTAGQGASEVSLGGTWVATDAALTLYNEGDAPAVVEFGYVLEAELLHMTDETGHVWTMRRR